MTTAGSAISRRWLPDRHRPRPGLEPRNAACAAKLKKRTLTNLYNRRPAWLCLGHMKVDAAMTTASGWV